MTSVSTRIAALAATVLCTALAPAAIAADTGGAAFEASSGDLEAKPHAMLGKPVVFEGEAQPNQAVQVQRLDDGAWVPVAQATADAKGAFVARWRTDHIGVFELRAVPATGNEVRAAQVADTVQVTVYKPAQATWYGKGWYGRKTACGYTLSAKLMGVAHKSLPCGTKVAFLFRGKTITVPVIDRGPYGKGLDWDLTTAAAKELGFLELGRVTLGAVSLKRK